MLLAVAKDEALCEMPDRHLAQSRMHADLRPVAVAERRKPVQPSAQPVVDAREEHADRKRAVPRDQADPGDIVRDPPEGNGRGAVPIHDPFQLTEPERKHLGNVGEDLARTPRRLGLRPESGGQRPGLAGGDPSRQCGVGAAGIGQPVQFGPWIGLRHGRQCRTRGVRCTH